MCKQYLKKIKCKSIKEANRFAFFQLWDELWRSQSTRFRSGEGKLMGRSGVAWSSLDLTPMRYFNCKLVQENIDLGAPPIGQADM